MEEVSSGCIVTATTTYRLVVHVDTSYSDHRVNTVPNLIPE